MSTPGRRTTVARAPVRNAYFVADNQGIVRFARGSDVDNVDKLYYRDGEGKEWKLHQRGGSNRPHRTCRSASPPTTRPRTWHVEQAQGPDAIVAMDVASGTRKEMLRDDDSDPASIIYKLGSTTIPVGASFMDGKPRTAFFDPSSPEARLYKSLEAAFAGESPFITSATADGKLTLVQTIERPQSW